MATKVFYPSAYEGSTFTTSSTFTYAIGDGVNDTDRDGLVLKSGSRAEGLVYYKFNLSTIPEDATIVSVSCKVKACVNNTTNVATATIQPYSGDTAKGTATSCRTTTGTIYTLNVGTWTRAELSEFRLQVKGVRGTSNTTSNAYVYFYGAELTVTYSVPGYTTESVTLTPNSYTGLSANYNSGLNNPIGKGSTNTTYATVQAGYKAEAYCYWTFNVPTIPIDAEIDSVVCSAKVSVPTTSSSTVNVQLYSGSIAKGSAVECTSSTATVYTISNGVWTRTELDNIRLRTYIKSLTNSNRNLYFYGADLTITYTYQNEKFMLKLGANDSWIDTQKVYKKDASGNWVEQTDLSQVIDSKARYKYGGHVLEGGGTPEVPDTPTTKTHKVTITGTGSDSLCYVVYGDDQNYSEIITSAGTYEVPEGYMIFVGVYSESSTKAPTKLTVNGVEYTGCVGCNLVVKSDCTVSLSVKTSSFGNYGSAVVQDTQTDYETFYLAGNIYQVTQGMTWTDWVASEYNPYGLMYKISDDKVLINDDTDYAWVCQGQYLSAVKPTDVIDTTVEYKVTSL